MSAPSNISRRDARDHASRPLLLDARAAHEEGSVRYLPDGTVILRHPEHVRHGLPPQLEIPPDRQYPAIRATFDDLNKPLSRLSNSPLVDGQRSLRELYEAELAMYEELAAAAHAAGKFEPDYGSYVYDRRARDLYLVAPERWHRLALVTSNAKLMTDPRGALTWVELRERLERAVIGFAGASVGSNLLEGWLREARPRAVKVADPDWVEITNMNRCERVSLRHLVGSRARRFEPNNPYETPRVSKAEYIAYEQQLVDPYLDVYVYEDGLTRSNIDRFLDGDGESEPPIDILVEETDQLEVKVLARQLARERRIDVLMVSDFGNTSHVLWNPFSVQPDAPIATRGSDAELVAVLAEVRAGHRAALFEFASRLCGDDFRNGTFDAFVRGEGEQPTSSVPQSGATAMASGAIGGKELAMRVLGHDFPEGYQLRYDLLQRYGSQGR